MGFALDFAALEVHKTSKTEIPEIFKSKDHAVIAAAQLEHAHAQSRETQLKEVLQRLDIGIPANARGQYHFHNQAVQKRSGK